MMEFDGPSFRISSFTHFQMHGNLQRYHTHVFLNTIMTKCMGIFRIPVRSSGHIFSDVQDKKGKNCNCGLVWMDDGRAFGGSKGPELQGSKFQRSKFQGSNFPSSNFPSSKVPRSHCKFQRSKFQSPKFQRSKFQGSNFPSSNFPSSKVPRSHWQVPTFQVPKFQGPKVQGIFNAHDESVSLRDGPALRQIGLSSEFQGSNVPSSKVPSPEFFVEGGEGRGRMTPWQHLGTRMLFGWGSGTTHVFQQCLGGWVGFWWSQIRLADFQVPKFQGFKFQRSKFQRSRFQNSKFQNVQRSKFQSSKVKVPRSKFQSSKIVGSPMCTDWFQSSKVQSSKFQSSGSIQSPHKIWSQDRRRCRKRQAHPHTRFG